MCQALSDQELSQEQYENAVKTGLAGHQLNCSLLEFSIAGSDIRQQEVLAVTCLIELKKGIFQFASNLVLPSYVYFQVTELMNIMLSACAMLLRMLAICKTSTPRILPSWSIRY